MIDFVTHLKEAVISGNLVLGVSKTQDWFVLLNTQDLNDLSQKLENVKQQNQRAENDYMSMLVFLLCNLEGFNLFDKFKDDITESFAVFESMLHLEILKRSGYVRLYGQLCFTEDCQVQMLKIPPSGH
jgi:hypothetical protein